MYLKYSPHGTVFTSVLSASVWSGVARSDGNVGQILIDGDGSEAHFVRGTTTESRGIKYIII